MYRLLIVAEVAVLACAIIVLIKQFQNAGALHGIIGIVTCTLWTFIWGWMNAFKLNLRNLMLIWTLLCVICIVVSFLFGFSFAGSVGSLRTT
jgi:hypothetical protein